jgi:AcrR family transcriptional regulator
MSRGNMSETKKSKRSYTSTRRQFQAKETRRIIIEAARSLFYERGYNNATIDAIAKKARVAPETIYAIFGNKQAILMSLIQATLAGDYEIGAFLERPFIKDAEKVNNQQQLIMKFAIDMYKIMCRMSPIFALLRSTAKTDPEIMAVLNTLLKERLEGMSFFVNQLIRIGPILNQSLPDQAATTVFAISSAEVFDLLTHDLAWSEDQYISWLSKSLERLIISC